MAGDKKRKRAREDPAASDTTPTATNKYPKPVGSSEPPTPTSAGPSTLRLAKEEEALFPRGGQLPLTPLEFKEVDNAVKRDALLDNGMVEDAENGEGHRTKHKQKREAKKGKYTIVKEKTDYGPRIEGLSYKRLVPGALVLGCVRQINKTDIALSLPNSLTGYVPLTAVSEGLTSKAEIMAEEEEEEAEAAEEEAEKEEKEEWEDGASKASLDLSSMFRMGQYLRAYVLHTSEERPRKSGIEKAQTKKRIKLSLYPRLANTGLKTEELVVGCMIQASVASVEDHGLVMDLGLEGDVKGFLALKDLGPQITPTAVQEGQVFLCAVTGTSSNGKIVKLSTSLEQKPSKKGKLPDGKGSWWLSEAPTIDAFLPGTGVELLITEVGKQGGLVGKIMGMLDAVIDYFHVAGWDTKELSTRFKPGNKIKARVIATFPNSDPRKIALSVLPHILSLTPVPEDDALAALPIATVVDIAKVVAVESKIGLFLDVGVPDKPGFVHISRISSESRIESLVKEEGPYKIGTILRARVTAFSSMDGQYLLSTEKRVLEQPYLRIDDIKVGAVIKGRIGKVLDRGAVIVDVADGISGIVEDMHLSDVKLKHPEKKFREGLQVRTRVLATNPGRRRLHLTMKKTLVNSDLPIISSYNDAEPGMQSVGTLVSILSNGAVVRFYASVAAFLPVEEMSEAYIKDPREHFRIGQSVNVHVVYVDSEAKKMKVSCKDPNAFGEAQKTVMANLKPGQIVKGIISEMGNEDVIVYLDDVGAAGLKGTISIGHLTDGSREKNLNKLKKLHAGTKLEQLVVLQVAESNRIVRLSMKPALIEASIVGGLVASFGQVNEGMTVKGYFRHSTDLGVFMAFAGGVTGLILKKHLPDEIQSLPYYGFHKDQTLTARVKEVDHTQQKFLLTMRTNDHNGRTKPAATPDKEPLAAINAIDGKSQNINDFFPGKLTKAQIVSVQQTQINVRLADNVQGRIDVSQIFDSLDAIENKKTPLIGFKKGDFLEVKVIGIHDARNHRFLAITHRTSNTKTPIFELTAKPSDLNAKPTEVLTLSKVNAGSAWLVYVNNTTADCVWVNLSPDVRGRIGLLDLSDDVSQLKDPEKHFPVGSVLKCHVTNVDVEHGKLDLSAKSTSSQKLTFDGLSKGMVVPARVTKVTDRLVIVQLSDSISGHIGLTDLGDDYSKMKVDSFHKNDAVRVCVLDIDKSNKRITLSTRPSRVLSSALPVRDPEIQTIVDVNVGDLRRGFVKNVSDKGLFVHLGGNVTAWVKIADLADNYIKDWKSKFQVDQLIEGRIVAVDPTLKRIQMSLRESSVTGKPVKNQKALSDFRVGEIVIAHVKKVAEYGVFIGIDGSAKVSGLCHKTEIADNKVEDVSKLYSEGDPVKAKILSIDLEKRRISFGLKASYFKVPEDGGDGSQAGDDEDEMGTSSSEDGAEGEQHGDDEDDESDGGINLTGVGDIKDGSDIASGAVLDSDEDMLDAPASLNDGLDAGGFDWTGSGIFNKRAHDPGPESDSDTGLDVVGGKIKSKKNKRRKINHIKQDLTREINTGEPTSVSDFERMLLSAPNDSRLWIQYMAFQLQLSELDKAREISKRALRTMDIREENEKLNIWTAILNMENEYGDDESLEQAFHDACQYSDPQQVHERLASIYIDSGKNTKVDDLFKVIVKKFSQDIKVWLRYAEFCLTNTNRPGARALLTRAMQALPKDQHRDLVTRFAILEFKTGDPERGRTLFENLIETYSKRMDLWTVFLDMELKYGNEGDGEQVRELFRRATRKEQCKPKQAKWLFKKWIDFEKKSGDQKAVASVTEKARKWVEEREKAVT